TSAVPGLDAEITWDFTTGIKDLDVVSRTPAIDAPNVAVNADVKVTLDFPVNINGVPNLTGITIDNGRTGVLATYSGNVLSIAHANFAYNKTYTVTIPKTAVTGLVSDIIWSFTTEIADVHYTNLVPAIVASAVHIDTEIKAKFNLPVNINGVPDLSGITIDNGTTGVSATFSGNVISIAHDDFAYKKTYTVTIPKTAVIGLVNDIVWSFTTEIANVRHTNLVPAIVATGVQLDTEIKATFNFPVNINGVPNLSGVTIDNGVTGVSATFSGNVISIAHADFEYNKTYTVTIPKSAIIGLDYDVVWMFTTQFAHLEAVSKTPAVAAPNVAVDADVKVTFNRPVNINSEPRLSRITISGAMSVAATYSGNVITIAHTDFAPSTTYTVTVPKTAIDGLDADVIWSFSVGNVPVEIIAHNPISGATGVNRDTIISVTLSKDPDTNGQPNWNQVSIKETVSGTAVTNVFVSGAGLSGTTYSIFHSMLRPNTQYTVTIPATAIIGLARDFSWSFTTGAQTITSSDIADSDGISVYPTLTDALVMINTVAKADISVVDLAGRTLETHSSAGGSYTLNLASRAQGVYFVIITLDDKTSVTKVIKK
ncbi:MAG: Ig-like domain-containing protein, partial [Paludibacter sp.]|nr:Ig-like domain-containing protein [Paludibacter sp.]